MVKSRLMNKFFILGNPRSGTSLFRLMLNAHKNIVVPPECGFLEWWYDKYGNWSLSDSTDIVRVKDFIRNLLTSRKIETWKLDDARLLMEILEGKPGSYEHLTELVYLHFAKSKGGYVSVIGDKNNYFIHRLSKLKQIWPKAYYILLIRDGRDVACSYLELASLDSASPYKPNLPVTIEQIATEWNINNEAMLRFLETEDIPFIAIKFEDLLLNTVDVLAAVCSFLNIDYDQQMLNYYVSNRLNQDEPLVTMDWKKKTLESPDANVIGRFKDHLMEEQIETFNRIAGKMLGRFNYL